MKIFIYFSLSRYLKNNKLKTRGDKFFSTRLQTKRTKLLYEELTCSEMKIEAYLGQSWRRLVNCCGYTCCGPWVQERWTRVSRPSETWRSTDDRWTNTHTGIFLHPIHRGVQSFSGSYLLLQHFRVSQLSARWFTVVLVYSTTELSNQQVYLLPA